ncbi:hypothetical protein BGW38_002374 [Lunasporangiospora selenospora]|uniref:Aminoglycoside phosphotransferase domain-containing protein n=1 Tax=Lunasporangiospora selenospora TaxID=979761 RepID=A0A9P6KDK3_9FUNG|nr:hypothetical protein BGW38_002374 [Lunasporangiospora selenospora]
MAFDLTTPEGTIAYLESTPFAATSAKTVSGGSSGHIYRVQLKTPTSDGATSAIIKHVKDLAWENYSLSADRIGFEAEALEILAQSPFIDATTSTVLVPKVLHYDSKEHALLIEDLGEIPTVKQYTSSTSDHAAEIGSALGTFLAKFHAWSQTQPQLIEKFHANSLGRSYSADFYFGQLEKPGKHLAGLDNHLDRIRPIALKHRQKVLEINEVLTIGDFWTGNVLVKAPKNENEKLRLYVIDLELIRPGPAYFDLGQFSGELYSIARFKNKEGGLALLSSFLAAYHTERPGSVEAGDVAVRLGSHLITVTPFVKWSEDKEKILRVATEGAEMIVRGGEQDKAWLQESVVRELAI